MKIAPRLFALALPLLAATSAAQVFGPSRGELRVNSYTTGSQFDPDVGIDEFSTFLVTWTSDVQHAGGRGFYGQRFSFTAPIGGEFQVNQATPLTGSIAHAAGGGPAHFVVVYSAPGEGAYNSVYGQRYGLLGAVGSEFVVNAGTATSHVTPDVAADSSGAFVVVFANTSGSDSDVFARRFDTDGTPLTGGFRVNTTTNFFQYTPAVSRGPAGAFLTVWGGTGANGIGIYGQRFGTGGAPLGSEFQVNTGTGDGVYRPDVAFNASGAVVVWERLVGPGNYNVQAQRFDDNGAPAGGEFRVNTYTSDEQWVPRVAMSSTGAFVVVWEDRSAASAVWAQRFTAAGAPRGGPFLVHDGGFNPAIAMNADGDFVVAWRAESVDGNGTGVQARVYCHDLAGNANGDGVINVTDVLYLINFLFAGGPAPAGSGDADGSGSTNVTDVLYLINFLFAGGPAPACPVPIV